VYTLAAMVPYRWAQNRFVEVSTYEKSRRYAVGGHGSFAVGLASIIASRFYIRV